MDLGGMASVTVSPENIGVLLDSDELRALDIAAVNSPSNVTVAGPKAAIDALKSHCDDQGIPITILPISRAFHSRYTSIVRERFFSYGKGYCSHSSTEAPTFVSSVTGSSLNTGEVVDIDYWWRNISTRVEFLSATQSIIPLADVIVEVGSHAVLNSFLTEIATELVVIPTLKRSRNSLVSDVEELLRALSRLYLSGVDVNWKSVQPPHLIAPDVALPPPLWNHTGPLRQGKFFDFFERGSLDEGRASSSSRVQHGVLTASDFGYIKDHVVNGLIVVPGAVYLSLALEIPTPQRIETLRGTVCCNDSVLLTI